MKKTLFRMGILCLLLTMTLSAVSCAGSDIEVPDGMQLCSDESQQYCFFVPASWIVNTESGTTSAYHVTDDSIEHSVSVNMTSYAPDTAMDITGYWDMCEADYESELKNYTFVSETKTVVAELNAMEYVYTADFSGVTYKFNQTIFIERSQFYIITYTARADDYDTYLEDLVDMRANLYFR